VLGLSYPAFSLCVVFWVDTEISEGKGTPSSGTEAAGS
jgi:hypothetical protein